MNYDSLSARRAAGMAFLHQPDASVETALQSAMKKCLGVDAMATVKAAQTFAESLEYSHPGQSKQTYLSHPMRVATDYLQHVSCPETDGAVTALIHNVMEVTNISSEVIARRFGIPVASAVAALTVDRASQWDPVYKADYYNRLDEMPPFVRRVKVLDKFDNLFFLCLNSSDETRGRYLEEIERWITPMAKTVLPAIVEPLCELVHDNRRIGFRPLNAWLAGEVS